MHTNEPDLHMHYAEAGRSHDQTAHSKINKKSTTSRLNLFRLFIRESTNLHDRSKLRSLFRETAGQQEPNCAVTEGLWRSAIYLGPGGPLMRDR